MSTYDPLGPLRVKRDSATGEAQGFVSKEGDLIARPTKFYTVVVDSISAVDGVALGLSDGDLVIEGVGTHASVYRYDATSTAPAAGLNIVELANGAGRLIITSAMVSGVVLSKSPGIGLQVDPDSPSFGWRDIIGDVSPKATGVGAPARAVYRAGVIGEYAFVANDVCDFLFHIPHDYVPGSDLFFHIHWSHNGTTITGNATFAIYYIYASRTLAGTAIFGAEKTKSITWATTDIATTPRYAHRVDETVITSDGGSATLIDRNLIEVDGLLSVAVVLTSLPTIGGGGKLFIHTCDLHYQSTNMATKNSAPDYYA